VFAGAPELSNGSRSVKDSLNRQVAPNNVAVPVSECVARGGDPQGTRDYVSYKGFGGVERRIYIGTNSSYLTSGVFLPNGLSYRQVQMMSKHKDPKTIMRYDHGRENLEQKAVNFLDYEE
jgi:hypothetical protein